MTPASTAAPLPAGFVFVSGPLAIKDAQKEEGDRVRRVRRRIIGAGEAP